MSAVAPSVGNTADAVVGRRGRLVGTAAGGRGREERNGKRLSVR